MTDADVTGIAPDGLSHSSCALTEGQINASHFNLQKPPQKAPDFVAAPWPWAKVSHPWSHISHRHCKFPMKENWDGTGTQNFPLRRHLKISVLVLLNSAFKWKTRSETQLLCGRASNSPKEHLRCVRQGGKHGKEDPKSHQGNFRWQEAKV